MKFKQLYTVWCSFSGTWWCVFFCSMPTSKAAKKSYGKRVWWHAPQIKWQEFGLHRIPALHVLLPFPLLPHDKVKPHFNILLMVQNSGKLTSWGTGSLSTIIYKVLKTSQVGGCWMLLGISSTINSKSVIPSFPWKSWGTILDDTRNLPLDDVRFPCIQEDVGCITLLHGGFTDINTRCRHFFTQKSQSICGFPYKNWPLASLPWRFLRIMVISWRLLYLSSNCWAFCTTKSLSVKWQTSWSFRSCGNQGLHTCNPLVLHILVLLSLVLLNTSSKEKHQVFISAHYSVDSLQVTPWQAHLAPTPVWCWPGNSGGFTVVWKPRWPQLHSRSPKELHPPKQTWNLKMDPWKRRFLLETTISRFHVNFWGCIGVSKKIGGWWSQSFQIPEATSFTIVFANAYGAWLAISCSSRLPISKNIYNLQATL